MAVDPQQVYVDHGLTGTNRAHPRLREALATCRAGDTLVVTKARPPGPLHTRCPGHRRRAHPRRVRLQLGSLVHDPADPVGRLLFNVLAMVAESSST